NAAEGIPARFSPCRAAIAGKDVVAGSRLALIPFRCPLAGALIASRSSAARLELRHDVRAEFQQPEYSRCVAIAPRPVLTPSGRREMHRPRVSVGGSRG